MNDENRKKDEQFWVEQHSWGDFPFDKPCLNLTPMSFVTRANKKKQENTLKHIHQFIKVLLNMDDAQTRIRYPLI